MLPPFQLDEITKKLMDLLPGNRQEIEDDLRQKIKMVIQYSLIRLDLVSREEFDVQTQVLAKTREKLESLEKQVQEMIEKKDKKS